MRIILFLFVLLSIVYSCQDGPERTKGSNPGGGVTPTDSIVLLTELIIDDSSDYRLFKKRAELFIKSGRIDPALRDINSALELKKDDPGVYILQGDV